MTDDTRGLAPGELAELTWWNHGADAEVDMTDNTEDFYQDPRHLEPAGPARKRQRPILSSMVPVQFPQDMIAVVKHLATQDGMTVSTWIRRLVSKEIERRQPPATSTSPSELSGIKADQQ